MRTTLYVLGTTALFALFGWWAASVGSIDPAWAALLGASLGLGLGLSFRPRAG